MNAPQMDLEVDLSDLPADIDPELREEIKAARLKTIEAQVRKLESEAELRRQRSLGQRYRAWALDDTIGQQLQGAFVLRGGQ